MLPLNSWRTVLQKTNEKATALQAEHSKNFVAGRKWRSPFTLDELMKFIGLLIMMSVVRGGEYTLYWKNPTIASFLMPGTIYIFLL